MEKQIFFHAELYKQLQARLTSFIERVDAAGEVLHAHFPRVPWNTKTLWLIMGERVVRDYLCDQLNRREAEALGLDCEWGLDENPKPVPKFYGFVPTPRVEPASPQAIVSRQLVRANTRKDREAFSALSWNDLDVIFLRTSVVSIGRSGETVVARDADSCLKDFCTLFAETDEQTAFVGIVERMRDHAAGLVNAYKDFQKAVPNNGAKELLRGLNWVYDPTRYTLVGGFSGSELKLKEKDVVPRALITFFQLSRHTTGAPKFYNLSGYMTYGPEAINAITWGEATGCDMVARFPELYPGYNGKQWARVSPRLIKEG